MSFGKTSGLRKLEDPGRKFEGLTTDDTVRPGRKAIASPTAAGEAATYGVDLISGKPVSQRESYSPSSLGSYSRKHASRDITGKVTSDSMEILDGAARISTPTFHKKKLNLEDSTRDNHDVVTGMPSRLPQPSTYHRQRLNFETTERVNPITGGAIPILASRRN
mmetsp:Transcript_24055/g.39535  ORF Transcript_24055/g.39535 Transcript_24055/m.39535 type:complete len:164 (+) Transcript_24055:188-679(+)